MSVGAIIELDVVEDHATRRLQDQTTTPVDSTAQVDPAATTSTTPSPGA